MAYRISVITAADGKTSPMRLITSLDTQTLSTDDFELILVDRGLGDAERESLRRTASRRPNIRIVEEAEDWSTETGEYVLGVQPDQKLFPEALSRLAGFAAEHSLDVVAGRPVQPRQALSAPFLTDQPRLDGDQGNAALTSTVVLARRERVAPCAATGTEVAAVRIRADGAQLGVLASYPASDDPALSLSGGEGTVRCDGPSLEWDGGELAVSLGGTVAMAGAPDTVTVVARQIGTHLSYVLPAGQASIEPSNGVAGAGSWRAVARLDPITAAAGQPLPPGTWELDVVLSGTGVASRPSTVPAAPGATALVHNIVLAVGASKSGALQIDVGPTRLPVMAALDPSDAAVIESARGSELRIRLPAMHVHDSDVLSGQLGLGPLLIPARIEVIDGGAWFAAFVSGLAGETVLSAKFGRSAVQPLGVSLSIAQSGEMTIIRTPAPAPPSPEPPEAAKPASPAKRKKKRKAKGPVAKLRRAVPKRLEPTIRKVAKQPVAKKIYRRLTGLAR